MLAYLVLSSLLIPANLWAAITPHLHSDLSTRLYGFAGRRIAFVNLTFSFFANVSVACSYMRYAIESQSFP